MVTLKEEEKNKISETLSINYLEKQSAVGRFTLTIPGDKQLIPALRDYNSNLFQTTASVRWTFIQLVSQAQQRHDCDSTIVTPLQP
ncbi:hypothetical protein TNCV_4653961 [Trichonephila clavipes]|nr:hypothetical protein TNCV_4653961 [Trichonephila clavipes]